HAPVPKQLPGVGVTLQSHIQGGPMAFVGLRLGPDNRLKILTPDDGIREQATDDDVRWRIDEITIDDVVIDHESIMRDAVVGSDGTMLGEFGIGSRVQVRATNIDQRAGYFYATWELEAVH